MASTATASSPCPVTMIVGGSAPRVARVRSTSSPPVTGIWGSTMSTSKARVAWRASPVSPSPATSTAYPARSRVRWARCACPASSSITRIRTGVAAIGSFSHRELHDGQKQAELAHGLRKLLVFHRFGEIHATPELLAALDFIRLIRRGQDNHRNVLGACIRFEPREHLIAVKHRQVQIKEQEQRQGVRSPGIRILPPEVIDGLLAIAERDDRVGDERATQVALD